MADRPTRPVVGILATLTNFPIVLVGLIAITTQLEGDELVSVVDLWAAWGIAQGLLGQVGLVSGYVDRLGWRSTVPLRVAGVAGAGAALIAFPFRDELFPGRTWWWLLVGVIAAAAFVIGRLRAELTLAGDGVDALVVTTLENSIRTGLVLIVLVASFDGEPRADLLAASIVVPFGVSLAVLASRRQPPESAATSAAEPPLRSVSSAILAGLPAVAAYAVVPALSIAGSTDDLDAFAIAASVARGPLLVATFAAPWLLELIARSSARGPRPLLLVVGGLLALQVGIGAAIDLSLVPGLVVHGALAGAVAAIAYVLVLRSAADGRVALAPWITIGATLLGFVVAMAIATRSDAVHPFVALSVAAVVVATGVTMPREPVLAVRS